MNNKGIAWRSLNHLPHRELEVCGEYRGQGIGSFLTHYADRIDRSLDTEVGATPSRLNLLMKQGFVPHKIHVPVELGNANSELVEVAVTKENRAVIAAMLKGQRPQKATYALPYAVEVKRDEALATSELLDSDNPRVQRMVEATRGFLHEELTTTELAKSLKEQMHILERKLPALSDEFSSRLKPSVNDKGQDRLCLSYWKDEELIAWLISTWSKHSKICNFHNLYVNPQHRDTQLSLHLIQGLMREMLEKRMSTVIGNAKPYEYAEGESVETTE